MDSGPVDGDVVFCIRYMRYFEAHEDIEYCQGH